MTLKVGIAGFGFMGRTHFSIYSEHSLAEVTHIFTRKGRKLIEDQSVRGNIGSDNGQNISLSGITLVDTFTKLCESDVDIIDICTPTFLHAEHAVRSLEAGKHTFLEKPMGLNTDEANRVLSAVTHPGPQLQVGQCLRFWPEYEVLKRIVDTGKYGGIKAASFRRLSPFPAWSAESWIRDPARSGGAALDLHIHDTDFVNYLFGRPLSVRSFGTGQLPNGIDHIITHYKYGDDKMVTAEGGWMGMPEFPFRMEFTVMCSRASVEFNGKGVSVYTEEGETIEEEISQGNGWTREIDYFTTCIAEGQALETVTPSSAREAVEIVCAEMESVRTEREVAL